MLPGHLRAKGIGDSLNAFVGPNTYDKSGYLDDV